MGLFEIDLVKKILDSVIAARQLKYTKKLQIGEERLVVILEQTLNLAYFFLQSCDI